MIIDFKNIPEQVIPSFNGGKNKILMGTLHQNCSVGLHRHLNDCEIVYVISGVGKVLEEGELFPLKAGDCHYCRRGFSHSIINDSPEDMKFFAVIPKA